MLGKINATEIVEMKVSVGLKKIAIFNARKHISFPCIVLASNVSNDMNPNYVNFY